MTKIELLGMEFYSHHGCFKEEQIIGNKFIVNFSAQYNSYVAAESDRIEDALNYQLIYNEISEQMKIKSHLLEHVALRILKTLMFKFPQIVRAEVSIDKLNPPLGGQVGSSRVIMSSDSL